MRRVAAAKPSPTTTKGLSFEAGEKKPGSKEAGLIS
jgi:hypothetical protein